MIVMIDEEPIKNSLRRAYRDRRERDVEAIQNFILAVRKMASAYKEAVAEIEQLRIKYGKYPSMKK